MNLLEILILLTAAGLLVAMVAIVAVLATRKKDDRPPDE